MDWLVAFVLKYKVPLLFYLGVILLIVLFRRKLEWQAPLVGLFKTQVGVKTMQRWATRHKEIFRWLGFVGIGVGFVGMGAIVWVLVKGLWDLVFVPDAPAVIAPVVPGFEILGLGITVPLITGWIALFIVIVIHEFSHGLVSKSHDIPIRSSGLLIFGPLLGAFVEPDEKKVKKAPDTVQYSIYAAGPFSNILSAAVFFLMIGLCLSLLGTMVEPIGVRIASVAEGSAAEAAGLPVDAVIIDVDGMPVVTSADFTDALELLRADESTTLTDNLGNSYAITALPHPDDPRHGKLGVTLTTKTAPKSDTLLFGALYDILQWVSELFIWVFILSIGIGLANLLPLGPVDGGRMINTFFLRLYGEERGLLRWKQLSKLVILLILVDLLYPIVRGFF